MDEFSGRVARMTALAILLAILAPGCQPARLPVRDGMVISQGEVLLDGQPLIYGQIYFVPKQLDNIYVPDDKFMAAVDEGRFEIEVTPGKHRVEVIKYEALDPAHPMSYTQVIPAAYNIKSQLLADVQVDGPNQFTFSLDSSSQ